jgi:hypothetical protein
MESMGPFQEFMDRNRGTSWRTGMREAAIYVNDTLYFPWLSAQQVLGSKATPEVALGIYDRMVQREAKELLKEDEP